jgi:hypothetical protein
MKLSNQEHQLIKGTPANAQGIGIVPSIGESELKSGFVPARMASWWCSIEDLLWSEKKIVDKIKRRAGAFAEAKIDTAINFGFHFRFNFADYFGQMNGYYANVCEELHKYGIKFMDHFSCNLLARPRGEADLKRINREHRHVITLFYDEVAAEQAQYEGHKFNDLCQIDLRDGSRSYARQYQTDLFCHNNPGFHDMHEKYLRRLMREVPLDAIEVDDMCDYAGPSACGCPYCRDRFKKDYGHEIPPFGQKDFWGDTSKSMLQWGNYENPVFRDWLRMKSDSVADHVRLVKQIVGDIPLMTCCSSTGPIVLNTVSLVLEKMAPYLDFFMLENVGTSISGVNWVRMDAEALQQKDIAQKRGNAPAVALSYALYDKGGYMGWCMSRFWGVGNWASSLNQGLEEDPADALETEAIISPYYNWEKKYSDLNYREGKDFTEVRLASSSYCRENGWRGNDGLEQWTKVQAWSSKLVKYNVGYRFVRSAELEDAKALCSERTPLILDSLACVSGLQLKAIKTYLSNGGSVWLALPFGTHDEKGFKREVPLFEELIDSKYKNLILVETATVDDSLGGLIQKGQFQPAIKQISGDNRWAVRIRFHQNKPVFHFMNTALVAVPHPLAKNINGTPILKDIDSKISDNKLVYEIRTKDFSLSELSLMSPELGENSRKIEINSVENGIFRLSADLSGIKIYAAGATLCSRQTAFWQPPVAKKDLEIV